MRLGASSTLRLSIQVFLISLLGAFSFYPDIFAQDILYRPGSIPLEYTRRPAVDLIYQGRIVTADQLKILRDKNHLDLSDLSPDPNTDIWQDQLGMKLKPELDLLELNANNDVEFETVLPAVTGEFRFSVKQANSKGQQKFYRLLIGKEVHAVLLRKNLLRKLGYNIPPVQYLPRVKVKFRIAPLIGCSDAFVDRFLNKKSDSSSTTPTTDPEENPSSCFISELQRGVLGDARRWITQDMTRETGTVEFQDVLAFDNDDTFYNLSLGYLDQSIIQGRRLLNSLLVPYSLVYTRESINGFPWVPGRISNQDILLDVEFGHAFTTPREDAEWILKRISKLNRKDFVEIVQGAYYPPEVSMLLVEKLIARRNWLVVQLSIKNTPAIPFNYDISMGDKLVNGELRQEWWPGQAARYAYPDPESPLSPSEVRAFFASKLISTAIAALVARFDQALLAGTDIEGKAYAKQYEAAKNQFIDFLKTGKMHKIAFGLYAFPTIDGDIGISRDVVIGEYKGADNMIQLADTIDLSVSGGVFVSALGLPTNAQFQAGYTKMLGRSYTHLRNLKSIKRALKEPFKNLLVTLLKHETGEIFSELLSPEYKALESKEKQKRLSQILEAFNKEMGDGDSFIIADTISDNGFAGVGYSLAQNLEVQAALYGSKFKLSRLQIIKKGESEIQIYKDRGDYGVLGFNFGLVANIPIITIDFSKAKGTANTKFYNLDLTNNFKTNPELENSLISLRQIFLDNSTELLKAQKKPYYLEHTITEKVREFAVLTEKYYGQESADLITIHRPEGQINTYMRANEGVRTGRDLQAVTIEVINALIEDHMDFEFKVPNPGSGDPGDTFKGKSFARNANYNAELITQDSMKSLSEPFFEITYRWKGWQIPAPEMLALISEVNSKFNYQMFTSTAFGKAEEFQLYALDVSMAVFKEGQEHLSRIDNQSLKQFILNYGNFDNHPLVYTLNRGEVSDLDAYKNFKHQVADEIIKQRKKYLEYLQEGDFRKAFQYGIKWIGTLELILPFDRFVQLTGGENNVYVMGRVAGFAEGFENGDLPIIGNTRGRVGSGRSRGSLARAQSQIGISTSSLYLNWILRNL